MYPCKQVTIAIPNMSPIILLLLLLLISEHGENQCRMTTQRVSTYIWLFQCLHKL